MYIRDINVFFPCHLTKKKFNLNLLDRNSRFLLKFLIKIQEITEYLKQGNGNSFPLLKLVFYSF